MGRFESIGAIQPFLKLQEGDWADVFKAYDTSLERNVLLKKLRAEYRNDADIAQRFEEEARLMAQVRHPNVVSVLSSGRQDETVYFVAEFIEGHALDTLISESALPPLLAVFVLREIACGLGAAHDKHIFHRDIKPSNILLSNQAEVKLTDFGMASILADSEDEEIRGTLGYIAPELLLEGEPGVKSDLFSLGATFFEMLTGRPAFVGAATSEVFDQLLNHDPVPLLAANPRVNPAIISICRTLLKKEPENRYTDCASLIEDLDRLLDQAGGYDGQERLQAYLDDPACYEEASLSLPRVSGHEITALAKTMDVQDASAGPTPGDRPPAKTAFRRRWVLGSGVLIVLTVLIAFAASNLGVNRAVPAERETLRTPDSALAETLPIPADDTDSALAGDTPLSENNTAEPSEMEPEISTLDDAMPTLTAGDSVTSDSDERRSDIPMTIANGEDVPTAPDAYPDSTAGSPAIQTGELNLLCTPFCSVKINGEPMGSAPPILSLNLPAGVHRLEMENPSLPVYTSDVVVTAGQIETVRVALLDLVGTIEISVVPYAKVYIDGEYRGEVPPVQSFILTPDDYTLRLEHPVLGAWETTILVAAGEKQPYFFNLKALLQE